MQRDSVRKRVYGMGFILLAGLLLVSACRGLKLGQATDDKTITTEVQAKLFDDSVLKMRDIHVASDNGTVTLTGAVATDLEKAAVERLARQAEGVKNVVNQVEVSSPSSAATPPAETNPSTPPLASAAAERPRASSRRHLAVSASNNETTFDQVSAQQAPAPNPAEMTAPAAPPAPAEPPAPAAAPPPPPPPPAPSAPVAPAPQQITIPAGTILSVRMIESIDSTRNNAGDEFSASLAGPVMVGDRMVLPGNSDARVRLVQASASGRVSGRAELKVELVSVTVGGQTYPLETAYSERAGASQGRRTAEAAGGGAVVGAIIGALAGRGRGAAVGSIAGAGVGTAASAATHGQQVRIPSETRLDFTLKSPVTLTLNPGA